MPAHATQSVMVYQQQPVETDCQLYLGVGPMHVVPYADVLVAPRYSLPDGLCYYCSLVLFAPICSNLQNQTSFWTSGPTFWTSSPFTSIHGECFNECNENIDILRPMQKFKELAFRFYDVMSDFLGYVSLNR
jgi:hypothetical protein